MEYCVFFFQNYIHTDHLDTPRFGKNTAGTQVWSWYSDAFGNGAPSGSVTVNLRMPGQYYDSQSGLFYNWNRYYNPATGRYVSSDPIGLNGGLNTFNYVEASPVMYSDPEGLQNQSIPVPRIIPIPGLGTILDICTPHNETCETNPKAFGDECGPTANANTADEGDEADKEKSQTRTDTPNITMSAPPDCKDEWLAARIRCSDILAMPPRERPPEIWGGSYDKCVKGQVSQACGGNRVD